MAVHSVPEIAEASITSQPSRSAPNGQPPESSQLVDRIRRFDPSVSAKLAEILVRASDSSV